MAEKVSCPVVFSPDIGTCKSNWFANLKCLFFICGSSITLLLFVKKWWLFFCSQTHTANHAHGQAVNSSVFTSHFGCAHPKQELLPCRYRKASPGPEKLQNGLS
ncbi:hypothetical protein ILYODFUR_004379 [Ilyodon furcidens]|uniref:Uncharacterized protein n=1 Tax=Ilyodon furcidens TaxID=33524 RepID=A0ABV0SIE2_9TELE